ncbi:MAG TPA: peptidoglycan DD-metalloendopeptidase family protein [Candidatus Dormibacteraeota bacterium]|jgi:murein DD-endopeptidase MepM/ murein hydrolase activator NlpD|nr:peptidoglycan DD-metalloendopeptidase family protein [Candidatus Dormibacteraeota bacterium]
MRTRLLAILLLSVLGLMALTPVPGVLADAISDKQQQQQQLNQQYQQQQDALKQNEARQRSAQAQLDLLTGQIQTAETHLADENARLDAILGQIDQVQRDLDATRARLERRQEILNQRTRTLYKQGGDNTFMDSLFTANNFSQLMDRFILMRDITHSDQVLVEQIKTDKAAIEDLMAQLSRKKDDQAATVKRIQDESNALRGQYSQQAALRSQLASAHSSLEQAQAENRRSAAAVASEIAQLEAARGRAHSSGIFAWPGVQGPITQGFGCTDFAGEPPPPPGYHCNPPYFHTGIDIAGPYGSTITATDGGIAYTYSSGSGYGNHVIIVHANGFTSLYGHMSGFAIGSGTAVAKGQAIGYEGSTGFSTGPHLHFEIRLNGNPVNPCNYVGC